MLSWRFLPVLFVFSFGFGQHVPSLKLDQMGEILQFLRNFEQKFQAIEARLGTIEGNVSALKESVLLNQDLLKEGKFCAPHHDLLCQNLTDVFEAEHELNQAVLNKTCKASQIENLQVLLATDECSSGLDDCSPFSKCQDSLVGFSCACLSGYHGDGHTCEDVDECGDAHSCTNNADCINSYGSYTCRCSVGYTGDGVTSCEDVDECGDSHSCANNADCINSYGSYTCRCRVGYTGDGVTSCRGCNEPERLITGLGCVIPVQDNKTFIEAKDNCNSIGGRLLEGITDQMQTLKAYFANVIQFPTGYAKDVWLGVFNDKWIEEGSDVPRYLFHKNSPNLASSSKCTLIGFQLTAPHLLWRTSNCGASLPSFCQHI